MSNWRWLCLFALLQGLAPAGHASAVDVSRTTGDELQVVADDATIDEVLARLAEHEGFSVAGRFDNSSTRRISVRLRGRLDDVLVRLMRNESFSLVFSATAPGRVERVVLVGAQTSRAATDLPATAPSEHRKSDRRESSGRAGELTPESLAATPLLPQPGAPSALSAVPAQGVPVAPPGTGGSNKLGDVPIAVPSARDPAAPSHSMPSPITPLSAGLFAGQAVPTPGVGDHHATASHPR